MFIPTPREFNTEQKKIDRETKQPKTSLGSCQLYGVFLVTRYHLGKWNQTRISQVSFICIMPFIIQLQSSFTENRVLILSVRNWAMENPLNMIRRKLRGLIRIHLFYIMTMQWKTSVFFFSYKNSWMRSCASVYDDYEVVADGYWMKQKYFLLHIPVSQFQEQGNYIDKRWKDLKG